jgi:hypothetical protein
LFLRHGFDRHLNGLQQPVVFSFAHRTLRTFRGRRIAKVFCFQIEPVAQILLNRAVAADLVTEVLSPGEDVDRAFTGKCEKNHICPGFFSVTPGMTTAPPQAPLHLEELPS